MRSRHNRVALTSSVLVSLNAMNVDVVGAGVDRSFVEQVLGLSLVGMLSLHDGDPAVLVGVLVVVLLPFVG